MGMMNEKAFPAWQRDIGEAIREEEDKRLSQIVRKAVRDELNARDKSGSEQPPKHK